MEKSRVIAAFLLFFFAAAVILVGARARFEAEHFDVTETEIYSSELPLSFDSLRILQISDLHGKYLEDASFWDALFVKNPDLVAITGDILSRGMGEAEVEKVGNLIARLSRVCPVYYVGGNHEAQGGIWEMVVTAVRENGGEVLSDRAVTLEKNGEKITLLGLRDPARRTDPRIVQKSLREQTEIALNETIAGAEDFTLLLAHRPEDVDFYSAAGVSVVLAGHAHGGQIQLPFVGALFAPSQGLFPKYSDGLYNVDGTQMYVSRGLGGDFRFLCPGEIGFVVLKCAK